MALDIKEPKKTEAGEMEQQEVKIPQKKMLRGKDCLNELERMRPEIEKECAKIKQRPIYNFFKRVFDFIAALFAIILLSPVLIYVAIRIRCETPGKAIFKQKRVGKNGKVFTMLKFRSMYIDAEDRLEEVLEKNIGKNTLMFKAEDDPRITPFGKKIRQHSVDELPQLFNILAGHMSFVGPRPPLPREVVQYKIEWTKRLSVVGGLTCYWQLSGRNDADFDFCYEQDMKYISNRGFWKDIGLIFKTVGHLFGKGGM